MQAVARVGSGRRALVELMHRDAAQSLAWHGANWNPRAWLAQESFPLHMHEGKTYQSTLNI